MGFGRRLGGLYGHGAERSKPLVPTDAFRRLLESTDATTNPGRVGGLVSRWNSDSLPSCPGTTCALWVMDSDGTHRKELFGGGVEGGPPVWSSGSNRLALF